MTKRRTQLYLDEKQREVLEREADRTGKSLGRLVREAVDLAYGGGEASVLTDDDLLWNSVGSGESGVGDISRCHDEYLYD